MKECPATATAGMLLGGMKTARGNRCSGNRRPNAIDVAINVEVFDTHTGYIATANGDDKSTMSLSTVIYYSIRPLPSFVFYRP
jgi:hypothetical protein